MGKRKREAAEEEEAKSKRKEEDEESGSSSASEDSDEQTKKKKKKHKKKDKKKKKKKDKKKKKNKGKEKDDDETKKLVDVALKMRKTYAGWKPISKKDYFSKSTEFRVWLQAKKKYLDDMQTKEAHKHFEKFAKKWNAGELPGNLYKGINRTEVEPAALTRHKWSFVKKLKADEKFQLARLRDDVDTDNQRQKFGSRTVGSSSSSTISSSRVGPSPKPRVGVTPRPSESAYDREVRRKIEKKDRKEYQKQKDLVMEELVPKETGREALIEKRKQKGAYARAGANRDDSVVAIPDAQLMGGGSDFQAAVARRNAWKARKAQARGARVTQAKQNERERMQNFLNSMGLQDKYRLQ